MALFIGTTKCGKKEKVKYLRSKVKKESAHMGYGAWRTEERLTTLRARRPREKRKKTSVLVLFMPTKKTLV